MRIFLTIPFLCCAIQIFAQSTTSKVILSPGVTLTGTIENFDASRHKYDTCNSIDGWKSICLIDGKLWFGSDAGLKLPRNQLTRLSIAIGEQVIELEVTGMYNPSIENELSANQFKFEFQEVGHMLYGYFSDGAGTYTAHWKIVNGKSIRQVITNDERAFYWQREN